MVPFTMTHVWRLEKRDEFPRRVQLGANSVGWFLDEVEAWCASRIRAGGRAPKRRLAIATDQPEAVPSLAALEG
jgi:predicted DNA-binding transcriptional regulator AlpA